MFLRAADREGGEDPDLALEGHGGEGGGRKEERRRGRRKEEETATQPNPQGCDQGVLHQVEDHVLLALLVDPGDSTGRVPRADPQNVSQV